MQKETRHIKDEVKSEVSRMRPRSGIFTTHERHCISINGAYRITKRILK